MSVISGGDLKEITFNHPTLGGGRFFSKAGESHMLDLGGYETDDDKKNVDSGGNFLNLKSGKVWSYECTLVNAENLPNRLEIETVQALSNSFDGAVWAFMGTNLIAYTGQGCVVGEVKADRSKGTLSFKVQGGGVLQQLG